MFTPSLHTQAAIKKMRTGHIDDVRSDDEEEEAEEAEKKAK